MESLGFNQKFPSPEAASFDGKGLSGARAKPKTKKRRLKSLRKVENTNDFQMDGKGKEGKSLDFIELFSDTRKVETDCTFNAPKIKNAEIQYRR
jgi:hypothetical protein